MDIAVVVDLDPEPWRRAGELDQFVAQLIAFLNAHLALQHENTLAVYGAFATKSVLLYSSPDPPPASVDPNAYHPLKRLDHAVVDAIRTELAAIDDADDPPAEPTALVTALTKALCYINRLGTPIDPRILILSVSPDMPSNYIPIMNSIFSAQKLKVTIDACQIFGPDTVFLQQAAHLTGGSYLYVERRDALLQYLTMTFLPPPSIRKILAVPTQDRIDFRAACFCHKNIVDIGFVCSVCLSIFCQPVPVCSTCRTKFTIKTLQRLYASRPLLPATPQARPSPADSGRPSPAAPPEAPRHTNGAKHS